MNPAYRIRKSMPTTNDYHVNTQFRMGTPAETAPTPVAIAPATPRMMGTQKNNDSNLTHNDSTLMPPVELQNDPKQQQPKQFHRKSLGDWDFLETVGAGSMGKVKLARHRYTSEICAIKIVNRAAKSFVHKQQQMTPPKSEQEVLERKRKLEKEISRDKRTIREASLGQILYHPHICRLFEMCTMSNHFYMLFEYVSGGQLLDYIIQHGSLRERHARKFARGIASALQYLHMNNIVHRDLKIENIMISTSGEIKIIDFGLSNMYDPKKQLHTFCGSLYFAAPELLKAHPYIGPEVDVWSFGVVLYVLVCGKVPFDDENASVLHEKIKQGKVEYPQHLSIEVISLLSKMLVVDPSKRATLKQVVSHQWMQRGYDFPAPSYLPYRVPLTVAGLDPVVIREMHRLELINDVTETSQWLESIVASDEYQRLSEQYWININSGNNQEDPTRAFHPLLSIYYLVDEMLKRKRSKLQRRSAAANSSSNSATLQQPVNVIPEALPTNNPLPPLPKKENLVPPLQQQRAVALSPVALGDPVQTIAASPTRTRPTVLIPPKLAIPEQAHTSPTSRKSGELAATEMEIDVVLSPTPQSSDYESKKNGVNLPGNNSNISTATSATSTERAKFGSIFRRLSQRRHHHSPSQGQQQQIFQEVPKSKKTHARTVSEYVPPSRITSYGSTPTSNEHHQAQQKQKSDLPALPSNAETLLKQEQQLQNNVQRLKIENDENDKEDQPLPLLSVSKGRKLHPSARAKSVGHARRESLKYMRPPVPSTANQQDVNDDGFLETSDDGKSDSTSAAPSIPPNSVGAFSAITAEKIAEEGEELTDQQILALASKAPPGTMPSIDYPRSLFLKGFFSVQTTSSKPLPIVRYKIISVLKKLNIEFKEVKGGFVCIHKQSYVTASTSPRQHQQPTIVINETASVNSHNSSLSNHRRNYSIPSRAGSIRRQGSISGKQSSHQPGIPATPLAASAHERNLSVTSPRNSVGNGSANEELSTASLESLHQDDMLTTSKAQDMNRNPTITDDEERIGKERPPLKFEIHIVKVRIVGLAGVHFKKVSGNTWMYKELASHILKELNL